MIYKVNTASICVSFWVISFYCSLVFYILGGVFNKTIIPLALVGYEMISGFNTFTHEVFLVCDDRVARDET